MGEPGQANPKNLIKLKKGSARTKKIASMGGATPSPKKKLNAKLRMIKKYGHNDGTANEILELVEDPEMSTVFAITKIREFMDDPEIPKVDRMRMVKILNDWHKNIHGTKDGSKAMVAVQINVLTPEQREAELKRILEMKKK